MSTPADQTIYEPLKSHLSELLESTYMKTDSRHDSVSPGQDHPFYSLIQTVNAILQRHKRNKDINGKYWFDHYPEDVLKKVEEVLWKEDSSGSYKTTLCKVMVELHRVDDLFDIINYYPHWNRRNSRSAIQALSYYRGTYYLPPATIDSVFDPVIHNAVEATLILASCLLEIQGVWSYSQLKSPSPVRSRSKHPGVDEYPVIVDPWLFNLIMNQPQDVKRIVELIYDRGGVADQELILSVINSDAPAISEGAL